VQLAVLQSYSLICIVVFTSIINQKPRDHVGLQGHSNQVVGNCSLHMWCWTPLLWQH